MNELMKNLTMKNPIKKLPDFMLIQYGNVLDEIMTMLDNTGHNDSIRYKLCHILQLQIDYELDDRCSA